MFYTASATSAAGAICSRQRVPGAAASGATRRPQAPPRSGAKALARAAVPAQRAGEARGRQRAPAAQVVHLGQAQPPRREAGQREGIAAHLQRSAFFANPYPAHSSLDAVLPARPHELVVAAAHRGGYPTGAAPVGPTQPRAAVPARGLPRAPARPLVRQRTPLAVQGQRPGSTPSPSAPHESCTGGRTAARSCDPLRRDTQEAPGVRRARARMSSGSGGQAGPAAAAMRASSASAGPAVAAPPPCAPEPQHAAWPQPQAPAQGAPCASCCSPASARAAAGLPPRCARPGPSPRLPPQAPCAPQAPLAVAASGGHVAAAQPPCAPAPQHAAWLPGSPAPARASVPASRASGAGVPTAGPSPWLGPLAPGAQRAASSNGRSESAAESRRSVRRAPSPAAQAVPPNAPGRATAAPPSSCGGSRQPTWPRTQAA